MSSDSQFHVTARYPGNLDRCRRCGYPRVLHSGDGGCGLNVPRAAKFLGAILATGGVLGGGLWLLLSDPVITKGSIEAFLGLVALVALVLAITIAGRD